MARARATENARPRPKPVVIEEITRGIEQFQDILTSIEDFSREGFPYRDAARAKAELQLRECVRRIFGERSPEFQTCRNYRLRTTNKDETAQSLAVVRSLIQTLEDKKSDLQGNKPPAKELPAVVPVPAPPAMTLVQAAVSAAQPADCQPPIEAPPIPGTDSSSAAASVPLPPPVEVCLSMPVASAQAPPVMAPPVPPTVERDMAPIPSVKPDGYVSSDVSIPPSSVSPQAAPPLTSAPSPIPPVAAGPPPQAVDDVPATSTVPAEAPVTILIPAAPLPPPTFLQAGSPRGSEASAPSTEADPLERLRKVCLRFHAVARQLRLRKDYRATLEVEDDYDLQDLLCALLKGEFDEVGTDEWTPPYAGGAARTAFLLHGDRIAVVAKKTRSGLTPTDLADQVAADSSRFTGRDHCRTLFCFIYDPEGRIGSPKRLETDLTSVSDRYMIDVLVAPK